MITKNPNKVIELIKLRQQIYKYRNPKKDTISEKEYKIKRRIRELLEE